MYVDERREEIDYSKGDIRFKVPAGIHTIVVKLTGTRSENRVWDIDFLYVRSFL